MIFRFVQESIRRAPRRKALIIAAIAMGSAVATAMLGVMLDIGDKINSELRSEGANIAVTARAAAVTGGVGSISTGAAANGTMYGPLLGMSSPAQACQSAIVPRIVIEAGDARTIRPPARAWTRSHGSSGHPSGRRHCTYSSIGVRG